MCGKNAVFTKRGFSANHKLIMEEVTQCKLLSHQLTETLNEEKQEGLICNELLRMSYNESCLLSLLGA